MTFVNEKIGCATKLTAAVCVLVYFLQLATSLDGYDCCVSATMLSTLPLSLHRLLTSNFLHGGALHLLFNMMALIGLGNRAERERGSIQFLLDVFVLSTLGALLNLLLSVTAQQIVNQAGVQIALNGCSIGISGFLFSLIVVHCQKADSESSLPLLCGMMHVPARVYPWCLLLLFALFPGVSFVGHFAGVLVGYAFAFEYLKLFDLSIERVRRLESLRAVEWLAANLNGFASKKPQLDVAVGPKNLKAINLSMPKVTIPFSGRGHALK